MIAINADTLFRAMTATGYKLLTYNLDLRTGEIVSRTLAPNEVVLPPEAPSVKPLPKMGDDLAPRKEAPLFGSSQPAPGNPKLFNDDDSKKPAFGGDFWKRDEKKKPNLFGEFKRESGSKKLAEIFGDAPKAPKKNPFGDSPAPSSFPADSAPIPMSSNDPYYPRGPAVSEALQLDWMRQFARDAGDPLIRDELTAALHSSKPATAFERTLRNHLRTSQQWERYLRKQALASGEAWLTSLGVLWELTES